MLLFCTDNDKTDEEYCRLSVGVAQPDGSPPLGDTSCDTRQRCALLRFQVESGNANDGDKVRVRALREISRREATEGADPEQLNGYEVGQQTKHATRLGEMQ